MLGARAVLDVELVLQLDDARRDVRVWELLGLAALVGLLQVGRSEFSRSKSAKKRGAYDFREAEVDEDALLRLGVPEEVGRLDVAVHDAVLREVVHRAEQLL